MITNNWVLPTDKEFVVYRNKVLITEKESDLTHKQVTLMQEATNECRNNYDALVIKDKAMAKRFKQEFGNTNATPAVLETLLKYFRFVHLTFLCLCHRETIAVSRWNKIANSYSTR